MIRPTPILTRTDTLFPYKTRFRLWSRQSDVRGLCEECLQQVADHRCLPELGRYRPDDQRLHARSAHRRVQHREEILGSLHPLHWGITSGRCLARSEEHTSELQSLMRISYAVFCLKKKNNT